MILLGLGQRGPEAIPFGFGKHSRTHQSGPAALLVELGQPVGLGQDDSAISFGLGQDDSDSASSFGFGQFESATLSRLNLDDSASQF